MPRRFAPRNDSPKPLSFRGGPTGRRGNPSFLRWTGVRAAVPRAWPPPTKFRSEIWGVGQVVGPYGRSTEVPATGRCGHRPLRIEGEATSTTWGSGAERSVCGADGRNEEESEQRSPPKGPATPDNPSVSLRLTAPFTQGSLGDGGCGLPRRPVGPPRNDLSLIHISEPTRP